MRRAFDLAFGRWGVRKGVWAANPMDAIRRPSKPEHLPRSFAPEEMRRIMVLELPPIERLVRTLLCYTGLRVIPICQIKVGDLSFDELRYDNGATFPGTIQTIGKGAKPLVTLMRPALKGLVFANTSNTRTGRGTRDCCVTRPRSRARRWGGPTRGA